MRKVRTAWPVATRVQYIVAFEDCQRSWGLSARHFCSVAEIPYSTLCPLVSPVAQTGEALPGRSSQAAATQPWGPAWPGAGHSFCPVSLVQHTMFDRLEAAMKEVREGRRNPSRASAMASLTSAMLKVIKAGEREASTELPPQFIVNNLYQWYADLRALRQMKPKLQMDEEEVKEMEADLDAFEKHYGRDIKLPKETL